MTCNSDIVKNKSKTSWFNVLILMMFKSPEYNILDMNAFNTLCMTGFCFFVTEQMKDL